MHQFEQEWQPTAHDIKAAELAERYLIETEEYDRTVCTGPIIRGSIMPMGPRELALVNSNALRLIEKIMHEAKKYGISRKELVRAIQAKDRHR